MPICHATAVKYSSHQEQFQNKIFILSFGNTDFLQTGTKWNEDFWYENLENVWFMCRNYKPKSEHNEAYGLIMCFAMCCLHDINSPNELIEFIDRLSCCIRTGHSKHFLESTWCAQVLVALAMNKE